MWKEIKYQKSTCSWKCRSIYVNSLNKGRESPFKGKPRWSEKQKRKIGDSQRGKPKSDEFREKCRKRMQGIAFRKGIKLTPEQRIAKSENSCKGDRHWNWRDGLVKENKKERQSIEYNIWRQIIFERDNFTCTECGKKDSGHLNADHIKPFAFFSDLRFDVDNGRTLCMGCHKSTETYFNKIRWKRTA